MATDPDALIQDARNYATNLATNGAIALSNAMSTIQQIGQGYVGPEGTEVKVEPPSVGDPGEVPRYMGTHFDPLEFKGKEPSLDTVGSLSLPPAPGGVPGVDTYIAPIKPVPTASSSIIGTAPTQSPVDLPTAPDIDVAGIPQPEIIDLVIPDMPTYVEPQFMGERVSFNTTPPTDLDVTMRQQYSTISPVMQSAITTTLDTFIDREFPEFRTAMAKLEDRLNTYLDGGTALTPTIENAIYNRTLDKTNEDANRQSEETWGKGARAGFTMPTPMLLMQMQNVDRDRRNNNARAATDIAIKQAELEQNNIQFAVTQSSNLRSVALNAATAYYSGLVQINGQALEYARSIVDSIVKAYDLATRYAEIRIRMYEADARVYEARLQGALAIFQAYTAKIAGVRAQADVDMAKVQTYTALLHAAEVEANVYRAQLDGVQALIAVDQQKIQLYRARVDTYAAQVNADTAAWQGYTAAVSGETAKIQASAERVRAYQAQVQAYEAIVRAKSVEINSRLEANTQKLQSYKTQVDAYSSLVSAQAVNVRAEIESFDEVLKAFIAKANSMMAKSEAEISMYSVALRGLQQAAQIQFEYAREHDMMDVERAKGASIIAQSIGSLYAASAQAALSGMNSLAASTLTATG